MSAAKSSEIIQISPEERKAMVKALGAMATHPNKPRTIWCRLRHVMRWTGWTEYEINSRVKDGLLRVSDRPGHRRLFDVQSVQELSDKERNGAE